MESFFAQYPPLKYDPTDTPSNQFEKVIALRKWTNISKKRLHYRYFLDALAAQNKTLGDRISLFFTQFPDFDYHSRSPYSEVLDAEAEFVRFVAHRKLKFGGIKYQRLKNEFDAALQLDRAQVIFSADMPSSPERRSISNTKAISQPPFEQTSVAAACANKCKNEVKNKQPQATESSSTTNSELGCSTYPDLPPLSISQRHFVQIKVLLKERREDVNKSSPIDDFFHNFPKFKYNPRQHPIDAYYRLAEVENWEGDDCTNEYPSFYNATREEFMWQLMRQRRLILVRNVRDSRKVPVDDMREGGGGDETLKGWERLCLIMDRDIPATPEEAEADLQGIFVNIYDLIHQLRIDRLHDLCHFANLKSLADYSYQTGKIYPWREAEGSTILEFLLRPLGIFKPKSKKKRGGQRNGRWAGGRHHGGRDRS